LLPEQTNQPARKDHLWQTTCFEFFVAPTGLPQYWEINLSPSADWNVYAFDDYRAGMREENAIASLPFTIQRQPTSFLLELAFPLANLIHPEQPIELAVSAVIQGCGGQRSFHALTDCAPQPDFHHRDSFILDLPA
jgi:hypothetical protein